MSDVSLSVQDRTGLGLRVRLYRALTRNLGHSRGLRVPFPARERAYACVLGGAMSLTRCQCKEITAHDLVGMWIRATHFPTYPQAQQQQER